MATALRRLIPVFALLLVLAGCGGGTHHPLSHPLSAADVLHAVRVAPTPTQRSSACDALPEGYGRMGVCVSQLPSSPGSAPRAFGASSLGVDTSHWDYCSSQAVRAPRLWFVSVGDGSYVDPCRTLVYAMARRIGIPHGTYYFARQYLDPIRSADHYAALLRGMGWSRSDPKALLPDDDAEAISSCAWLHSFDGRLKSDLGVQRIIDYDAPGLWPGCAGRGNIDWTAEYGPRVHTLSGFGNWSIWQFTDGHVGGSPHCWGVCGDVDTLRVPIRQLEVSPPRSIPYAYWQACSTLDHITFWRRHHHLSPGQHRQSLVIRELLHARRIGCSAPPHSYPFRGAPRRGALANP